MTKFPLPVVPPVFNAGISRWGYHFEEFQFSSTGRYLNYRINKFMKLATDKEIFFVDIDSSNYLSTIPSGYYFSTPSALKQLHYVTSDFKAITFEPLDVKYNRPNKVLEAIGITDTALIRSYRKAYERRIKKIGIDTTAFRSGYSVPEADFANRDDIKSEQKDGKIKN